MGVTPLLICYLNFKKKPFFFNLNRCFTKLTSIMAMSGVKLNPECNLAYSDIQAGHKNRYAIFKIKDGCIVLDKIGPKTHGYKQFLSDLQVKERDSSGNETAIDDCRFAVYDYEYTTNPEGTEPTKKNKVFLMMWCPDTCKVKNKMIYASSFDTLKSNFIGYHKVIQANGSDQIEEEAILSILSATDRK